MDNLLDEIEIKVEYYEDNIENDPLSMPRKAINSENLGKNNFDPANSQGVQENINNRNWFKSVDNSGRFQCRYCNLTYSTIQTVRQHTKVKHSEEAETLKKIVSKSRRDKKIKCHICKEFFKLLGDLKQHMDVNHETDNANFCHVCGAVFEDQLTLSAHMLNKHNVSFSRLHSCDICGYRTSKLSHFNQHINTHTNIKTYKCKLCDYATGYLPNLRNHERIHGNTKSYICEYIGCGYRSTTNSSLRSHKLKHERDENLIYCDKCTYNTVYKQSLKKHMCSHYRNSFIKLK